MAGRRRRPRASRGALLWALAASAAGSAGGDAGRRPKLLDCQAWAAVGELLCVCGRLPEASGGGLRIDRHPADIVAGPDGAPHVRIPPHLTPGTHVLSGDPAFGFAPADQVLFRAVRVSGRVETTSLLRGQAASAEVRVEGGQEPYRIRLTNDTPRVVALSGGDEQIVVTSGGGANRALRRLHGLRRGDFRLRYRLEEPPPCACPGTTDPDPAFVAGRVLALLALGPAPALEAMASSLAAAHGLAVNEIHRLESAGEALIVFGAAAGADVVARAAALARDPRVRLAQPDLLHETAAADVAPAGPGRYGRRLIGADRLARELDGQGVKVALVDTAVDAGHAALSHAVVSRLDFTGQGFGPDVHGTLLAGIIAALPGGPMAVEGVAPRADILALKACRPESPRAVRSRCSSSALARAVDAARLARARVLNLSLAGAHDALVARLLEGALREGTVVVAAAGHGPGPAPFPASMDGVLAVTAVDESARPYAHARSGPFLDLAAPGVDVLSTVPGGEAAVFSGTSAAAAFATGAIALLLQQDGTPRALAVPALLGRTARDLGDPGHDPQFGHGLLDVCRAVAATGSRPCA